MTYATHVLITGVVLALIPGLPTVELAPELVLLLVLPPIVSSSAVAMSWREFRFSLRLISLLALGCVAFTTVATAAAAHWVLGLPWPVGFVLGAIVSPPDAVAPLSVARRMQLPRRILVVLEGEGLANDATALVLYRFAVAAVSAGMFSLGEAATVFAAIVAGELLWGIGVGWLMLRLRRWVRDPRIEITLSILTPFLAYWPPEHHAFVLSFTGVRGIVSLAAALAIPFATATGAPFPGRELILFLTFSVILVTLVGQGLMLPSVIRALGLAHAGRREHEADKAEECDARRQAAIAALSRLDALTAAGTFAEEILRPIRTRQRHRLDHIEHGNDLDDRNRNFRDLHDEIEFLLIGTERRHINEQYRRGVLTDVSRRRIERELDLREAELLNQRADE